MRHLLLAILCTSAFVMAGEGGGAGANGEPGTPAVAPTVQSQQPQPHPYESNADRLIRLAAFHRINLGMAPLEVAALLGMDCTVEVSNPIITVTWWHQGEWMAVVFIDCKAVSKQKGSTK